MSAPQKKTDPPTAAEVDELGGLQAWLALNKSKIDREEELRKKIQASYDDSPADQDFQLEGEKFIAVIGPRGNQRRITDIKKVFKALGAALFFKICTVPFGKLDALLDESKQKGMVAWDRSGSRTVKAVAKVSST